FFYRFLISRRAGSLVKSIARISILGVWLGVTALIIVVSVMNGFNRSIKDRLLEVEPHLVIDVEGVSDLKGLEAHPAYQKIQDQDVTLLAPKSHQDVILRTSEGFVQHAVANGVTRSRLRQLLDYANKKKYGENDPGLLEKIEKLQSGEVILGVGLADSIGLFQDDSVVLIPPETLLLPAGEIPQLSQATVRGFLLTDVPRIDGHSFFFIIGESFPRLKSSPSRKMGVEIWLKDPYQAATVKEQLNQEGVRIETWEERNASLFFALKMEKMVVSLLVGLSTLIAGLSIISVMVLLLTQKRKDIGNLLAMGMTRNQTRRTFVSIGLFLALAGVVGGVVTGVSSALFIDAFSKDVLPAFYEETNIPAEVKIEQILLIVAIGFVLSFAALQWTMRKLSSYRPSEILRG
ncbi:MAG: FtsX-like permease family protein, partial [Pseudomonadota bacterium]